MIIWHCHGVTAGLRPGLQWLLGLVQDSASDASVTVTARALPKAPVPGPGPWQGPAGGPGPVNELASELPQPNLNARLCPSL